jgi:hypothetical protein
MIGLRGTRPGRLNVRREGGIHEAINDETFEMGVANDISSPRTDHAQDRPSVGESHCTGPFLT